MHGLLGCEETYQQQPNSFTVRVQGKGQGQVPGQVPGQKQRWSLSAVQAAACRCGVCCQRGEKSRGKVSRRGVFTLRHCAASPAIGLAFAPPEVNEDEDGDGDGDGDDRGDVDWTEETRPSQRKVEKSGTELMTTSTSPLTLPTWRYLML